MHITEPILIAGAGCTAMRARSWLPHIQHACALFAIDTPQRVAAFLAQAGHESGRLVYVREIWGPTPAQSRYEGRADLGNVKAGDGRRYAGRGLIQTTGRANYRATRDGLRKFVPDAPDFEALPEALEQPAWAALSAAWYWHSRSLNALADLGTDDAFVSMTRKINGGVNGLADRRQLWAQACKALGVAA